MRRIIVLLATGLLLFVGTGSAQAHPWADWYGQRWRTGTFEGVDQDQTVDWRFVNNFCCGTFRDSVQSGSTKWNAVSGVSMTFHFESSQDDYGGLSWDDCPANYQADRVGIGDFGDAGWSLNEPLAVTKLCPFADATDKAYNFRIKFNEDTPWYKDNGDPSNGQWDAISVAAHEFGHATGRTIGGDGSGHFLESSTYCPADSGRHTMCPSTFDGTSWQRSLEAHDIDTFQNAYP